MKTPNQDKLNEDVARGEAIEAEESEDSSDEADSVVGEAIADGNKKHAEESAKADPRTDSGAVSGAEKDPQTGSGVVPSAGPDTESDGASPMTDDPADTKSNTMGIVIVFGVLLLMLAIVIVGARMPYTPYMGSPYGRMSFFSLF
jgi:hypothetical protein